MYICICTVYIYTYIYTYTSKSSISLSLLVLPSPFSRVKLKPVFFVKICVLLGSISFRPFSFPEWTPPWFFASTSLRVDHSQTTLHNSTVNGSLNNFQKTGLLKAFWIPVIDIRWCSRMWKRCLCDRSLLPAGLGASESSSGSSAVKSGPRLRFALAQSEAAPEPQKSVPRNWTAVYFFIFFVWTSLKTQ